jgi:hypothetical protein
LSNKSIGTSPRTQTFFFCKLHQYWFKILNGQQTLKHTHRFKTRENILGINLLTLHCWKYWNTPFQHAKVVVEWVEWNWGWVQTYTTFSLLKMESHKWGPTFEDTLTPKSSPTETFLLVK